MFSRLPFAHLPTGVEKVALTTLERKIGAGALQQMGLSTTNIIVALLALTASLGSVLGFVFLGVQAFATGGAFNAIVNS